MTHKKAGLGPLGAMSPLFLLIFIDAMGFAMIAPILAAHPLASNPTQAAVLYGLAIGLYPLATFFAAPMLGSLSDQIGRKPVLLLCGAGLAVSYGVMAWGLQTTSAALVLLGRGMGGITAATQAVALATLADMEPATRKDARINVGLLASSLGFVFGPILAGALAANPRAGIPGEAAPLLAVAALTVITLAWLMGGLPPSSRRADRAAGVREAVRSLQRTFQIPSLRRLAVIFLLQQLGWGAFFFFIPAFVVRAFSFDASDASFYMAMVGTGFCLSFALVMPVLRKFFTARAIGIAAMAVTSSGILLLLLLRSPAMAWSIAIPVATAAAVGYGALIMLFTDEARGNEGEVLGATASINAFAFGATAVTGGFLSGADAAAPLLGAALLLALATLFLAKPLPPHTP